MKRVDYNFESTDAVKHSFGAKRKKNANATTGHIMVHRLLTPLILYLSAMPINSIVITLFLNEQRARRLPIRCQVRENRESDLRALSPRASALFDAAGI